MYLKWKEHKNRFGSIEFWSVSFPIGVWMDIHPINKVGQTLYRIDNARIEGVAEYTSLDRAKEVCEDLYIFIKNNPTQMTDVDLRNYPEIDLKFYDCVSKQFDYKAQIATNKRFVAPIK